MTSAAIDFQRFAVGFGSVAPQTRRKFGLLWLRGNNSYPSGAVATEIMSKPVWHNYTEWRLPNGVVGAEVYFRLDNDFGGPVQFFGFRFD